MLPHSNAQGLGDALRITRLLVRHREMPVEVVAKRAALAPDRVVTVVSELVAAGLATVVMVSGDRLVRAGHGLVGQPATRTADDHPSRAPAVGVLTQPLADSRVAAERCCALIESATSEVLVLLATTPLAACHQRAVCSAANTALSRGVRVVLVIDQEHRDEELMTSARRLADRGADIGLASSKMEQTVVIADEMGAVVETWTDEESARARAIGDRVLCRVLASYANGVIERMAELGVSIDDRPTPLERQVALLLAQGLTDMAAAKHVGVTDRTFRRHVRSLLGRLGAQSRFEAGAKAVLRGWL